METRDPKQGLIYDEDAISDTTNQIRDAYESGVMDHPNGSFSTIDKEDE